MIKLVITILVVCSSLGAAAADLRVQFELHSYPTSAERHFQILQAELAQKAIETCGGRAKVAGISQINIAVNDSVTEPAGKLQDCDLALNLWYPRTSVSATVSCK